MEPKKDLGKLARKEIRIYSQLPMNYQLIFNDGRQGEVISTLTKDISTGGILFESDRVIPLDAKVKITLSLPGAARNIEAISKIVRVEEVEFKEQYNIGVMFVDIGPQDSAELLKLVEHLDIIHVLDFAVKNNASDIHLSCNMSPIMRINDRLIKMDLFPLRKDDLRNMIYSILSREQIAIFERTKELDLAFSPSSEERFRVNVHQQMGNVEAAFRVVPNESCTVEALKLPEVVKNLALLKKGIVIIGGPTGSGKTTTLSAMVDLINNTREAVVISLEKPIEYIHQNKKSIIKQREIGIDTASFAAGFQSALRQDPDVIVVGEMSDRETISTAIIAAETGHLVLSSLHAPDTAQLFDRMLGVFPADQQRLIAQQLSRCFEGAVVQILLPAKMIHGRIVATEVLVATDAVKNMIRSMNFSGLASIVKTGAKYGMHLMEDDIKSLCDKGLIDIDVYMSYVKE
ncbi:MAG: PilT/PilU family type 4a pilus ATPase [Candidatus Omnitrophota bacterium]|nr:PilT/PilU family type 4a pilus ATPase [Candidatus Omnitrophota bacterium]